MVGGEDRAPWLAGGIFAVLAQDRDELGLNVGELSLPIPLYADPLVGPALLVERLDVDGNVVLCLAGNDAGLAAGTPVQVHYHSPFVVCSLSYHWLTYLCFLVYVSWLSQPDVLRRSPVRLS